MCVCVQGFMAEARDDWKWNKQEEVDRLADEEDGGLVDVRAHLPHFHAQTHSSLAHLTSASHRLGIRTWYKYI